MARTVNSRIANRTQHSTIQPAGRRLIGLPAARCSAALVLVIPMSTVAPLVAVGCGVVAIVSGAASGGRHSIAFAAICACVGFVLGIASYFGVVFPYVGAPGDKI